MTYDLELDGVRVPESDRLTGLYGDQGADADAGGFASVQRGLNIARVHTAARAVGVAQGALEDTWAYLQEREQFGHPLAEFQALRFVSGGHGGGRSSGPRLLAAGCAFARCRRCRRKRERAGEAFWQRRWRCA